LFLLQVLSAYSSAEGDGGEPCKLEALATEGDADDGHAPQKPKHDKGKCERNAAQYKPNHVCNRVAVKICINRCAKGPNGDSGKLYALTPEGDADDGDAKQNSQEKPRQSRRKACENKPQNVSYKFHFSLLFVFVFAILVTNLFYSNLLVL
jgi:hypothetical protein